MPKTTPLEYVYYALQLYCSGLSFLKKEIRTLIFINQKKPCISLELDSEVQQAKEDIVKEKERQ